jgi:glycogen synthase
MAGEGTVRVFCFGEQNTQNNMAVSGFAPEQPLPAQDARHRKLFDALYRNICMAGTADDIDIVHCHTWYAHLAGCIIKQLLGVPLVLTTHSLEPHRPWKEEQLGSAYRASLWIEKTAYRNADGIIAVSRSMKHDAASLYGISHENIRIIHNGIDPDRFSPSPCPETLRRYGIDPDLPYVLFVGRITRQKGIIHLVNAIKYIQCGIQIVLCAGEPDTEAISREMHSAVADAGSSTTNNIIWIPEVVPVDSLVHLYTHASVFVCPSVYEPFGIINLEAMACGTPVVASAVGGIPDIVIENETGLLVPFTPVSAENPEPESPDSFSRDLAASVNRLLASPDRIRSMSTAARKRVEDNFTWTAVARQTVDYYRELTGGA